MSEAADRVRTLLLRGDNLLKMGKVERARAAFEEALTVAEDPRVRELVERRLRELPPRGPSTRATTPWTRRTRLWNGCPSGSSGCAARACSCPMRTPARRSARP